MSSRDMTITEIKNTSKSFDDTHTVKVYGFPKEGKPPKWFSEFANYVIEQFKKQEEFNKQQLEFNKFVIDQFKKHGWVK